MLCIASLSVWVESRQDKHATLSNLVTYSLKVRTGPRKQPKTFDHSTVTRWLKKFRSGSKNIDDKARLGQTKTRDSDTVLLALEANPASSTRIVSGELSVVGYLHVGVGQFYFEFQSKLARETALLW